MRTLTSFIAALLLCVAALHAQYGSDVFSLKKAQDMYDERGFAQGKTLSIDGKLIVSESNGNVSYSYPIAKWSKSGYQLETSLNYCGSVGFTAFRRYVVAHHAPDGYFGNPYAGWEKFHQNRPAWLLGVNGFAVQALGTSTHFVCDPHSKLNSEDPEMDTLKDKDLIWAMDGYDFSNRMIDFGAYGAETAVGNTFVDNIRLLRSDGSILELTRATERSEDTSADRRRQIYSGYYLPMEANSRGYAIVEFDSTYWMQEIRQRLPEDDYNRWPITPRVVRYYPGDGLEYVFREWIIPFGQAYFQDETRCGGYWGGPTMFYLEEINGGTGRLMSLDRSRHYPTAVPGISGQYNSDSSRGRALFIGSYDAGMNVTYGINSMTIEAFGRSTKVKFGVVMPSGHGTETDWMPIAGNGYMGTAGVLANYNDTTADLYKSYLGYVTEIIDPEGRRTDFTYEPYERRYVNFGFPQSGVTIALRNYRLRSVTEPDARYTVDYFRKQCDLSYAIGSNESLYLTSSGNGDTLSVYNDGTMTDAAKLTNVAGILWKADAGGTTLTSDHFRFSYTSGTTFAESSTHYRMDEVSHDTVSTEQLYRRFPLPSLAPKLPPPFYTSNYRTTTTGAGDTTVTESWTSASPSTTSMSAWGSTYNIATARFGTPFLILDTAQKTSVNGLLKSWTSMDYTIDTARRYGPELTLRQIFGLDAFGTATTVRNPATGGVITTIEQTVAHLPYFDTTATLTRVWLNKFAMLARWDSLRAIDTAIAHMRWEQAMYDPRILVTTTTTETERLRVAPVGGLPTRTILKNAAGHILQGKATLYRTTHDPGDPLSYTEYGLKLADSIIADGGSAAFKAADYGYVQRLPVYSRNVNGAETRQSFSNIYTFSNDSVGGPDPVITSGMLANNDSVRPVTLAGALFGNMTEEPMATRSMVRRYATGGGIDTSVISQYVERSYFGQVTGTRDANGWYSRVEYDADGRVRTVWHPGDFQSPDTVYLEDVTGRDSSEGYGLTQYVLNHDTVDCNLGDGITYASQTENVHAWGSLFADDPSHVAPACPECGRTHEKGGGRTVQALCTSPIPYIWQGPAEGSLSIPVLPPNTQSIVSLDSARLRLFVTSVIGECVTLKVTFPALSLTKTYLFGCTTGGGGGGGGSVAHEKHPGRTLQSSPVAGGFYLDVDLTSVKSSLLALGAGAQLGVLLDVSTPDARVEFASGFDGADVRPMLMLKGTFRKINRLADYTLAYSYNDDSLTTSVTAKVDDSLHSANIGRWNPLVDIARRATARNRLGADWRLLSVQADIRGEGSTPRVDTTLHAYTGFARRTKTKDPEHDSVRTVYDALGRPVQTINADGTSGAMSYAYGSPASLGISGQEFYGFCSREIDTNENHVAFARYMDAFGRLRREVAAFGDSTHLNLTTRYEYDSLGRLS
ncbi:MAG: hypothetical protein JST22_17170, partial [Bacteroidetes bacterium]|nr:hypothetical protein [Bacteroidota bacterium]